jgi:hypothetical protein
MGTATAPHCDGTVKCSASAECNANCHASASANFSCSKPQVTLVCSGDAGAGKICDALIQFQGDIGAAWAATFALKDQIGTLAGKSVAVFQAVGDIGAAGATCFANELTVAAQAEASISVSFNATANVQGQAQAH